jgi:hypothetical protein
VSRKTTAGMGLACGICCALPMLLVAGVLSVGTAAFAGIATGAVVAVCSTAYLVMRRRTPKLPGVALLTAFVLGVALSGWGLVGLADDADRAATGAVAAGLALLACVTLLRLPVDERQPAG